MSQIIRSHGGEVDKFIGDKILAVFTLRGQTEAKRASVMMKGLATAEAMRTAFTKIKPILGEIGPVPELHLGIGLTTGPVLAGILGAETVRLEYTVIGDTVNLASRLADLALNLESGGILLEGSCAPQLISKQPELASRLMKIELSHVKGKTRAISILKLIC